MSLISSKIDKLLDIAWVDEKLYVDPIEASNPANKALTTAVGVPW